LTPMCERYGARGAIGLSPAANIGFFERFQTAIACANPLAILVTLAVRAGWAGGRARSDDKWTAQVGCRLRAHMLNPTLPVRPEVIIAQAVMLQLDQSFKPCLQRGPLGRIDLDFENRILHALAEIAARLGDTPQARCTARFGSAHVIGHEHEHGRLPSA
jgi:hypothetical protein